MDNKKRELIRKINDAIEDRISEDYQIDTYNVENSSISELTDMIAKNKREIEAIRSAVRLMEIEIEELESLEKAVNRISMR